MQIGFEEIRMIIAILTTAVGSAVTCVIWAFKREERIKEVGRAESTKLWQALTDLRNDSVRVRDFERLSAKLDAHYEGTNRKLDKLVELATSHARMDERIKNIENIMRVD